MKFMLDKGLLRNPEGIVFARAGFSFNVSVIKYSRCSHLECLSDRSGFFIFNDFASR